MMRTAMIAILILAAAGVAGYVATRPAPRPAPAASPLVEMLPCGHPRRLKTMLGKDLVALSPDEAWCQDHDAHHFSRVEGTWVPAPERQLHQIPAFRDDVRPLNDKPLGDIINHR